MSKIRRWLESQGMGQYTQAFEANDIDVDLLAELTDEALRQLGVSSVGHRLRLLAAITSANYSAGDSQAGLSPTGRGTFANALAGERRQATVLFSDLSGYTAMNERLDPEEVRAIVGRIKADAVLIVETHGGIVNQFLGDEVMALFGVPQAHEDDPVRAVRAARDLHAAVRALAPALESRIGAHLRLHSGISCGLIVTGTEDRRDGTFGVTGDAVNTGARLAAQAEVDTVLVSQEVARLIADYFQTEPLAPVELKGKSGRVRPYRVAGKTGIASRFEAAAQRGFTAYAGREAELALLTAAFANTRRGQGQFVTVMGEPGIGKSRLLFEFRHSLPRDEVSVHTVYCQSSGRDKPYLPMVDALKRVLRLDEVMSADALHDHTEAAVRAISPALERHLAQYLHLIGVPSEMYKIPATLQGDGLRRAFEKALADLITEAARQKPVVLVYEDWHWADDASESALKYLCGLIAHHALLVIVTHRPEYERKWADPQNHQAVVLQPLGAVESAAILSAVWRVHTLPEGLAAQVHSRTGGNPLFNEEMARALTEDGKITVTEGRAVLTGALVDLQLPNSVHAVVRARVDRLPTEAREVLRLASVIGREFELPLLKQLNPAQHNLSAALGVLAQQDLIYLLRIAPEPAYLFKHALVQDVVYETLLRSQRKQLHAQTGATIEVLYRDHIEEHYEALADHYSKSDNNNKAIEYLERAGDKALRLSQAGSALEHYRRAVSLLAGNNQTRDNQRMWVRVALKWGRLSWVRPIDVIGELNRIIDVAHELGDTTAEAKLIAYAGIAALYVGDHEAKTYFERAIERAGPDGDLEARGLALQGLGQVKVFALDLASGLALNQRAALLLAQLGTTTFHRVNALGLSTMAAARLGKPTLSGEIWQVLEKTMQGNEDEGWWTWWNFYRSNSKAILGHWHDGARYSHKGVEQGSASSNVWGRVCCEMLNGLCTFWIGEPNVGLKIYERGLQRHLEVSGAQVLSWWHGILAELFLIAGNQAEAIYHLKAATTYVEKGDITGKSFVLRTAALLAMLNDCFEDGTATFCRCIEFTTECGIFPEKGVTQLRYAECLHKRGDSPAALEQLENAEKLFADMEMMWWGEQASGLRRRIESGSPFVWFAPFVDGPRQATLCRYARTGHKILNTLDISFPGDHSA